MGETPRTNSDRGSRVNKIVRTDIAMIGTKLKTQVTIKHLEYQDWARLQGTGPHMGGPKDRLVGWRMW